MAGGQWPEMQANCSRSTDIPVYAQWVRRWDGFCLSNAESAGIRMDIQGGHYFLVSSFSFPLTPVE